MLAERCCEIGTDVGRGNGQPQVVGYGVKYQAKAVDDPRIKIESL